MRPEPSLFLAFVLAGCTGGSSVTVDVQTDFAPGTDFVEVSVELRIPDERTLGPISRIATGADDFSVRQHIGTFDDVPLGTHSVTVELRNAGGGLVASSTVLVAVMTDTNVTVRINAGMPPADAGMPPEDAGMPPEDAGVGILLSDYCSELAAAFCAASEACCSTRPGMLAECVAATTADCSAVYALTVRPELQYDPVAAASSLARVRGYLEACDVEFRNWTYERNGLYGGIIGTVPAGASCTPNDEMLASDLTVAAVACVEGQICERLAAGDWRCAPIADDGERCALAFHCVSGRCMQDGLSPSTCGTGEPDGSPCARHDECASLACLSTGGASGECVPQTVDAVYCPPPP